MSDGPIKQIPKWPDDHLIASHSVGLETHDAIVGKERGSTMIPNSSAHRRGR